jgi:WD40 repeat protein
MEWECLQCGTFNDRFKTICTNCELDKDKMNLMTFKILRGCEECGHLHRKGVYCHVYVEQPIFGDDDLEDGDLDAGDGDNDEKKGNSDDDNSDAEEKEEKTERRSEREAKFDPTMPLPTRKSIKDIGFIRCNCTEGIPEGSKRYVPCPKRQYAGDIEIATVEKLSDAPPIVKSKTADEEELEEKNKWKGRMKKHEQVIPLVLPYCELGKSASAASKVCQSWNIGVMTYLPYVEMRNCIPWQNYRPHKGQVDAIAFVIMPASEQRVLFSGGDRRILASDVDTGETIAQITRDSGEIPLLFETDGQIICASSNGSMRVFSISHVLERTKLQRTMWEHSRCIRGLLMSEPSRGYCKAHGIENHVCEFYTACEDRRIIVWDQQSYNPIRMIESKSIRHHSYISLAQTERHLIAGTSDASIFVFSKKNHCERDDVHACSTPGFHTKKTGCLQVALRLPPSIKTESGAPALVCGMKICWTDPNYSYPAYDYETLGPGEPGDPNYANMRLYVGDSTGQLTIWTVPEFFGIDYRPVKTNKLHTGTINQIVNTSRHLITLGNDGLLCFIDLKSLIVVRKMDVLKEAVANGVGIAARVNRKLKSAVVREDKERGGELLIGTSLGDVFIIHIGTTV